MEHPLAYRIGEAVEVSRLPRTHLFQAIREGKLRSYRVGNNRYVAHDALVEYLSALEGAGYRGEPAATP
jgi:excisionase family DNA binding protein